VKFERDNADKDVLIGVTFDDQPFDWISPERFISGARSGRLIRQGDDRVPCSCIEDARALALANGSSPDYTHKCNGIAFGRLKIFQIQNQFGIFVDAAEYFDLMAVPTTFGEDLEIMALACMLQINIAVWMPYSHEAFRKDNNNKDVKHGVVQCYYRPRALGTIVLLNTEGQGHYDWLTFKDTSDLSIASKEEPFIAQKLITPVSLLTCRRALAHLKLILLRSLLSASAPSPPSEKPFLFSHTFLLLLMNAKLKKCYMFHAE